MAVWTVAQQKGGSGKTTLATNLAVALMRRGRSVACLDADPQGSLGRWFMTRAEAGDPGMELSTASAWGAGWEVKKLRRAHDDVVIDTPPKLDNDLRPALAAADRVLIPVGPSLAEVWALEDLLDLVAREKREAVVVLSRARPGTRVQAEVEAALAELPVSVAATRLGQRVAYAEALGAGWAAAERAGPGRAEVEALVDELSP